MKYFLTCFLALFISSAADAATLYRWVDKEGKVHYGDRPASDAVKAERRKISSEEAGDEEDLPYSVRKAKEDFPVTLYFSANCQDLCNQATTYLTKRGIPYTEKNIASKQEADELKRQEGIAGIPSLKIGNTVLNGFAEVQWGNELDLAGYPKTAPYGMRLKKKESQQAAPVQPEDSTATENQQPAASAENPQ